LDASALARVRHISTTSERSYFGRTMELTGANFRVDIHDVVANDEHAVQVPSG
jgi:hypothetical protein